MTTPPTDQLRQQTLDALNVHGYASHDLEDILNVAWSVVGPELDRLREELAGVEAEAEVEQIRLIRERDEARAELADAERFMQRDQAQARRATAERDRLRFALAEAVEQREILASFARYVVRLDVPGNEERRTVALRDLVTMAREAMAAVPAEPAEAQPFKLGDRVRNRHTREILTVTGPVTDWEPRFYEVATPCSGDKVEVLDAVGNVTHVGWLEYFTGPEAVVSVPPSGQRIRAGWNRVRLAPAPVSETPREPEPGAHVTARSDSGEGFEGELVRYSGTDAVVRVDGGELLRLVRTTVRPDTDYPAPEPTAEPRPGDRVVFDAEEGEGEATGATRHCCDGQGSVPGGPCCYPGSTGHPR